LAGVRRPLKISGLKAGKMTISCSASFDFLWPTTSSNETPSTGATIVDSR
jgi:hypothetical protein